MRYVSYIILQVIALCCIGWPAYAASVDATIRNPLVDPGDYLIQQEKRRRLEEQLREKPIELDITPKKQDVILPPKEKTGLCFDIHSIDIQGVTVFETHHITQLVKPYIGCIGQQDIIAILQTITNYYIDAGYVTSRASLVTDQNIKESKILQVKIIEGTIEDIELNNKKFNESGRLITAFPGAIGSVLNVKNLEQGISQMNRLASSDITMTLWPGKQVGSTKIMLRDSIKEQEKDKVRVSVHYDNYGQDSTGKDRIRLTSEYDNMLSLNDSWTSHIITSRDTNAVTLASTIPYGYWTMSLSSSYSEFLSVIDRTAEMFGTTWNHDIGIDRVVNRTRERETRLKASLNVKETERILNDIALQPQPLSVMRLGATHTERQENAIWYMDMTYSKGLTILGALEDSANTGSQTPKAQFNKLDGGITYIHIMNQGGYIQSALRGQYAFDTLYGSEQIHLGDNATVRGFTNSPISGDTGLYTRNDWYIALPDTVKSWMQKHKGIDISPYILADGGVTTLDFTNDKEWIAGIGTGIRFSYKRMSGEAVIATPVYADSRVQGEGTELYLTMSMKVDEWW